MSIRSKLKLSIPVLFILSALSGTLIAQPESITPKLVFDVATIKPSDPKVSSGTFFTVKGSHVLAVNVDLLDLISFAYSLHIKQIVNAPAWLQTDKFDIDGVPNMTGRPNHDQQRQLYQSLLADRLHLVFHYETRELPVYALTVEKSGPKLVKTDRQPTDGTTFTYTNAVVVTAKNASMAVVADGMQAIFMDRPVVDQTGLKDRYDFILKWTPDEAPASNDPSAPPGLYTAIKEQLGLKLAPTKAPVTALVVDDVQKPSAN
jgi:uncharacterized protein (TIGR03435 family)